MVNERKAVLAGIGVLTVALAGVLALIYVRGQAPGSGPADEAAAKVEDEHDHGPLVVELLRTPLDVPAFAMTDLDGRTISSDSLKGKVVLINFWATWCGPCVVEIPDLVKLQDKYRDQLVVIGVSEDENGEALVRKFAADKQINYPLVMSTPELQALFPGVVALPTTFALDRNGKMVQKHVGLLHAEQTEALARVLAGLETDAQSRARRRCQQPERGAHRRDQERARRRTWRRWPPNDGPTSCARSTRSRAAAAAA